MCSNTELMERNRNSHTGRVQCVTNKWQQLVHVDIDYIYLSIVRISEFRVKWDMLADQRKFLVSSWTSRSRNRTIEINVGISIDWWSELLVRTFQVRRYGKIWQISRGKKEKEKKIKNGSKDNNKGLLTSELTNSNTHSHWMLSICLYCRSKIGRLTDEMGVYIISIATFSICSEIIPQGLPFIRTP